MIKAIKPVELLNSQDTSYLEKHRDWLIESWVVCSHTLKTVKTISYIIEQRANNKQVRACEGACDSSCKDLCNNK